MEKATSQMLSTCTQKITLETNLEKLNKKFRKDPTDLDLKLQHQQLLAEIFKFKKLCEKQTLYVKEHCDNKSYGEKFNYQDAYRNESFSPPSGPRYSPVR